MIQFDIILQSHNISVIPAFVDFLDNYTPITTILVIIGELHGS